MRYLTSVLLLLAAVSCRQVIVVENPLPFERIGEMVETEAPDGPFKLMSADGKEVPYQITRAGTLVFQASVPASGQARYRVVKGRPAPVDTLVTGAWRKDRLDDIIWENDRSGYRVYGPALQSAGEEAFGYDVFTKSVKHPVMKARFDNAIYRGISFHEDHGDGMDVYPVGPTLGCGTAALLGPEGGILYPWAWETCEIVDNGPLRFTLRLTMTGGKESRLITCDAGAWLNKVVLSFADIPSGAPLVAGIVIHSSNPEGYISGPGYIGYAELGSPNPGANGEIYCGVLMPAASKVTVEQGHILLHDSWKPGFTYWFGSSWSKGDVPSLEQWEALLQREILCKEHPLKTRPL